MNSLIINDDLLFPLQNLIPDRPGGAIPWENDKVFGFGRPLFEDFKTCACVHHAGGCKEDHGGVEVDDVPVKRLNKFEVEDIFAFGDKLGFDVLVGPICEKFVVKIGFFSETSRKVDRVGESCSFPVVFE